MIKTFFVLYFAVSVFAIVWLKAAVVNLEYEIGDLDRLRAELANDQEFVVAERSKVMSMGHVEKVALRRLGMRYAERKNLFVVTRTIAAGPRRASARGGR